MSLIKEKIRKIEEQHQTSFSKGKKGLIPWYFAIPVPITFSYPPGQLKEAVYCEETV